MTIRDVESSGLEAETGILAKLRAASGRVDQHVYPVFAESEDGEFGAVGSAVLGRLGACVYLVSAAHVFDHCTAGVFIPQRDGQIRALEGATIVTGRPAGAGRDADRIDIGFVRLTTAEIDAFGIENAVDLEVVGGPPMLEAATMFVALGYPLRDQKAAADGTMTGEPTTFMTGIADEQAHALARIDRNIQFLIRLEHRVIATHRSVGAPPSMRGMSGGGVWPVRLDAGDGETLVPFFAGLIIEQPQRYQSALAITRGATIRYFIRRFDDQAAH